MVTLEEIISKLVTTNKVLVETNEAIITRLEEHQKLLITMARRIETLERLARGPTGN